MIISREQLIKDLKQLEKELLKYHPMPFKYLKEDDFKKEITNLINDSPLDIRDFGVRIKVFLAKLKDSHTNLFPSASVFGLINYPIQLKYFKNGYYIIKATERYKNLLGAKLLGINNINMGKIEKLLIPFIPLENQISLRYYIPTQVVEPILLKYVGITKEKEVEITIDKGKKTVVRITPENYNVKLTGFPSINKSLNIYEGKFFKETDTYYFEYNSCKEREDLPISKVVEEIQDLNPKYVIIDLRNNKGGDSEILEKLIKFLKDNTENIKTVIFTGSDTYSSAIINLVSLSQIPNSISIGEIPHGNITHFGETKRFTLKNSNLTIQVSTKLFKYEGYELGDIFKPMYLIENNIEDYSIGVDTQMEFFNKEICRDGY